MFSIQGKVRDKRTGAPINKASIVAVPWQPATKTVSASGGQLDLLIRIAVAGVSNLETSTDETGTYRISNMNPQEYLIEISARGYQTYQATIDPPSSSTNSPSYNNQVFEVDADMVALSSGELKGRVLVSNLESLPMAGVRLGVDQNQILVADAISDSSGAYTCGLIPEGRYTISVDHPEKNLLKPASTSATVAAPQSGVSPPGKDVAVEMFTVSTARLGLKNKEHLLMGGGPVTGGYCKMIRLKPDGTTDKIVQATSPNASAGDGYGWFEFYDLLPGVYAVTFYRPAETGLKELAKYTNTFSIGRHELEAYKDTPYPIGSTDGKNVLQESYTSLQQVADQISTITGMIKDITGIMTDLGIKVPSA